MRDATSNRQIHRSLISAIFKMTQAERRVTAQVERELVERLLGVEGAEVGRRALVLELTGRRSNLVLLGKGDEVLDILVPAPKKQEHPRLVRGETWQPPPGHTDDSEQMNIEEELPEPSEAPTSVQRGHPHRAPLSYRVECALAPQANEDLAEQLRRDLTRRLERRLSRTKRALIGLDRRSEAAAGAERVMQDGELLKAAQAAIPRGAESIKLPDYFDPEGREREISLDPKLSPSENASKYFARYKKLMRSADGIEEEQERHEHKLSALEGLLSKLSAKEEDPAVIEQEALSGGLLEERQEADKRKRKAPAPRLPYKRFTACRGSELRVGRTAKDNDQLTFRHATGDIDVYVWDTDRDERLRGANGRYVGSNSATDDEAFTHRGPAVVVVLGYDGDRAPYTLEFSAR